MDFKELLAAIDVAVGPVEGDGKRRGVDEHLAEERWRNHLLEMREHLAPHAAPLQLRSDEEKTDLVHLQAGHSRDPTLGFVHGDVEEPRPLADRLERLSFEQRFPHLIRETRVPAKAIPDERQARGGVLGLELADHEISAVTCNESTGGSPTPSPPLAARSGRSTC